MPNYYDDEIIVPDNPDEDYFRTIYERGGLADIPEAEKAQLLANTRGYSASGNEASAQRQQILAELDAFEKAQEPEYIPYKPREENPNAPTIVGYGDKMLIKKGKDDAAMVDEWGDRVSEEYARDVEAKVEGREPIPQAPPTEQEMGEFEQFTAIMNKVAPDIEAAAKSEADELADRETRARLGDPVHQSLMNPKERVFHEDKIRTVWNNAYQKVKDRETKKQSEFARMYIREQKASAKAMQDAKAQAEKDAKKEAEHIQKRQEKIEDDLRKGKITNLNNMEREARGDLKSLLKIREKRMLESKSKTGLTEEEEKQLATVEKNIAEIVNKREAIYGGGKQATSPQQTTTKKLIGKKNGKPVYDLGNGKWQIGD